MGELLGLAFAAGLVAALNPCGFALLPTYLAVVVGDRVDGGGRAAAVGRAAVASLAMTLGFVAVFAAFGALTVPLAALVQRYLPVVTVVIGVALAALGLWLLAGRPLRLPVPAPTRGAPTRRLGSMFGYGMAYAAASLSCTAGPFLAVTAAAARSGGGVTAATVYLAYAAGFALIVGTLALASAFTSTALAGSGVAERLRRTQPVITRIGGALVLLVGLYVAYYGSYEIRLIRGGSPADAVITAAGRVQGTLAGWVHDHGALPWLAALGVLAVLVAVSFRRSAASVRPEPDRPEMDRGPRTW